MAHILLNESEFVFTPPTLRAATAALSEVPTQAELAEKARQDRELELIFNSERTEHSKKRDKYAKDKEKLCSMLIKKCNTVVTTQLEEMNDYYTFSLTDPVRLLSEIKNICLTYKGVKHPCSILNNAVSGVASLKQLDDEHPKDFAEKVKNRVNILFDNFITICKEEDTDYLNKDPTKRKEIEEAALEKYMAYLAIVKSSNNIYKDLKDNMKQQHSLGNKKYPETLTKAMEILNQNYSRPRRTKSDDKDKDKDKEKDNGQGRRDNEVQSHAQTADTWCFKCGRATCKRDHTCTHKDKPPQEWAANKAMAIASRSFAQAQDEASVASSITASQVSTATENTNANANEDLPGWMNHFQILQFAEVPIEFSDCILLDTQSGASLFCNKELLQDIIKSKLPMFVKTNAGTLKVIHKANLPLFGQVWFNPKAITNILSFAEVQDHPDYTIFYDEDKDAHIVMHKLTGNTIPFTRMGNHYVFKPKEKKNDQQVSHMQTVEDNKKLFTAPQKKRADRARALLYATAAPTYSDLKHLIRANLIQDNPVTEQDIDIAKQIYGPEMPVLKGKSTRSKPTSVQTTDYIQVPKKLLKIHKDVHLYMDIMYANGIPFLTSISGSLMFRHIVYIKNSLSRELYVKMDIIFRDYVNAGYAITHLHTDNQFQPLLEPVSQELRTQMHFAAAQEHVPQAERNHRVIKERFRTLYHGLPFQVLPILID